MSVEISFIIPVYNGEKWILRCIHSLQKWDKEEQTEIIIVNDGSKDATGEICEQAAREDGRIRVVHIENSGQGIARNKGLHLAVGEYIHFVDADDWVDTENLYHLWQKAKASGADIVMGSYVRVDGSRQEWIHLPKEGFAARKGKKEEIRLYHRIKTESCFGYLWNKIYKRKFLISNDLRLDDIRKVYMEDTLFNLKVWSKSPVLFCTDVPVYYYVVENVSTTRKADAHIHIKNRHMLQTIISYLEEEHKLEENLDMVIPLIMRTFCWSALKNVPYEGNSLPKLKERIHTFTDDGKLQQIIRKKGAGRYLFFLPSYAQRVFYSFCLLILRKKMANVCALMFFCLCPLFISYTKIVLK